MFTLAASNSDNFYQII